jgi:methyl-accepting chemotaxis protein
MPAATELLFRTIISSAFIAIVLVIIYWRFGVGLAFKIYAIVLPITGVTFIVGQATSTISASKAAVDPTTYILSTVIVGGLAYLYRLTVKPLREYSLSLQGNSTQLAASATQSATTAAQQSAMATEINTTIEEITQTSRVASNTAKEIVDVSANALKKSQQGQISVREALEIMVRISRVSSVVDTINKFAEQSNLLALNASIEAAKAGEFGLGFGVVAAEVRNLAEQSNKATQEIRDAIELTSQGQSAIETVATVIQALTTVLEDASERSRRIAGSAMQQVAGIEQINEAVQSLSQGSQDAASSSRQIEQSSVELTTIGAKMQQFIGGKQSS